MPGQGGRQASGGEPRVVVDLVVPPYYPLETFVKTRIPFSHHLDPLEDVLFDLEGGIVGHEETQQMLQKLVARVGFD